LGDIQASKPADYFTTIDSKSYAGKWRVVFFWPKDFTFICPTEIAEFGRLNNEFADRDAQVIGASVDGEYVHYAWRIQHKELLDLPFPMLSDVKHELVGALGVLGNDGYAQRATFIVDPDGVVQFAMVTAGSVGRNVSEVLRVLDALQTEELCACNWQKGQATIDAGKLMAQVA
jgi:peroxiredoxin (alkyl hydroperoxide reductase subunit C)